MAPDTWTCSKCGQVHADVPQGYSLEAPWPWYITPDSERQRACELNENYCVLFNEDFFVRACLEIPVIGRDEPFIWGVWVSLSKENFDRERSLASASQRIDEAPYFGWLSSRIQIYPDTLLMKTRVHPRTVGLRPYVELEPTSHPLSVEQRSGITHARVREIGELIQHKWLHPQWDTKGLWGGIQ